MWSASWSAVSCTRRRARRRRHAAASSASSVASSIIGPFGRGIGGPGGWIILDEPELHLGRRRCWCRTSRAGAATRMPEQPDVAAFTLVLTAGGDAVVRAEPFDAIELALASLWAR
jgi:hypothetical protein